MQCYLSNVAGRNLVLKGILVVMSEVFFALDVQVFLCFAVFPPNSCAGRSELCVCGQPFGVCLVEHASSDLCKQCGYTHI